MDPGLAGLPGPAPGTRCDGCRSAVDEIGNHRAGLAICTLDAHPLSGRRGHSDIHPSPPVLAEQPDLADNRPER